MTNERIWNEAEKALRAAGFHGCYGDVEVVSEAMRGLVAEAYEEAAQIAEQNHEKNWRKYGSNGDYSDEAGQDIAASIRALKDSLLPETASP